MTITRVGSNAKYAAGWEAIFGNGKKRSSRTVTAGRKGKTAGSKSAGSKKKKKAATKVTAKKASGRTTRAAKSTKARAKKRA